MALPNTNVAEETSEVLDKFNKTLMIERDFIKERLTLLKGVATVMNKMFGKEGLELVERSMAEGMAEELQRLKDNISPETFQAVTDELGNIFEVLSDQKSVWSSIADGIKGTWSVIKDMFVLEKERFNLQKHEEKKDRETEIEQYRKKKESGPGMFAGVAEKISGSDILKNILKGLAIGGLVTVIATWDKVKDKLMFIIKEITAVFDGIYTKIDNLLVDFGGIGGVMDSIKTSITEWWNGTNLIKSIFEEMVRNIQLFYAWLKNETPDADLEESKLHILGIKTELSDIAIGLASLYATLKLLAISKSIASAGGIVAAVKTSVAAIGASIAAFGSKLLGVANLARTLALPFAVIYGAFNGIIDAIKNWNNDEGASLGEKIATALSNFGTTFFGSIVNVLKNVVSLFLPEDLQKTLDGLDFTVLLKEWTTKLGEMIGGALYSFFELSDSFYRWVREESIGDIKNALTSLFKNVANSINGIWESVKKWLVEKLPNWAVPAHWKTELKPEVGQSKPQVAPDYTKMYSSLPIDEAKKILQSVKNATGMEPTFRQNMISALETRIGSGGISGAQVDMKSKEKEKRERTTQTNIITNAPQTVDAKQITNTSVRSDVNMSISPAPSVNPWGKSEYGSFSAF